MRSFLHSYSTSKCRTPHLVSFGALRNVVASSMAPSTTSDDVDTSSATIARKRIFEKLSSIKTPPSTAVSTAPLPSSPCGKLYHDQTEATEIMITTALPIPPKPQSDRSISRDAFLPQQQQQQQQPLQLHIPSSCDYLRPAISNILIGLNHQSISLSPTTSPSSSEDAATSANSESSFEAIVSDITDLKQLLVDIVKVSPLNLSRVKADEISSRLLRDALNELILLVLNNKVLQLWAANINALVLCDSKEREADDRSETRGVFEHLPSELVLSFSAALLALHTKLLLLSADSSSSTAQRSSAFDLMNDRVWKPLTKICFWWVQEDITTASSMSSSGSLEPCSEHRRRHLLRSCARLNNLWQKRLHIIEQHDEYGTGRSGAMSLDERTAALGLLTLLLRSVSDTDAFEHADRAQVLVDVCSGLQRISLVSPRLTNGQEPHHVTVHPSINTRLFLVRVVADAIVTSASLASSPVSTLVDSEGGCVVTSPVLMQPFTLFPEPHLHLLVQCTHLSLVRGVFHRLNHPFDHNNSEASLKVRHQTQFFQLAFFIESEVDMACEIRNTVRARAEATITTTPAQYGSRLGVDVHPLDSEAGVDLRLPKNTATPTSSSSLTEKEVTLLRLELSHAVCQRCIALSALREPNGEVKLVLHPTKSYARDGVTPVLVPLVVAFVHRIWQALSVLPRRHYYRSDGREVLEPAVHTLFVCFMAAIQTRPIECRRKDPRFVKMCPGDIPVGVALELLYFSSLIMVQSCRSTSDMPQGGSGDSFLALKWGASAKLLFRFVMDALLFNTKRALMEGYAADATATVVMPRSQPTAAATTRWWENVASFFVLEQSQYRRPTLITMPVWQLRELLVCLEKFCSVTVENSGSSSPWSETLTDLWKPLSPPLPSTRRAPSQEYEVDGSDDIGSRGISRNQNGESKEQWLEFRNFVATRSHHAIQLGTLLQRIGDGEPVNGNEQTVQRRKRFGKTKTERSSRLEEENGPLSLISRPSLLRAVQCGEVGAPITAGEGCNADVLIAARAARRIKSLSNLITHLGLDFDVKAERRKRRGMKREIPMSRSLPTTETAAASFDDLAEEQPQPVDLNDSDSHASSQVTLSIQREKRGGASLGFVTDTSCRIQSVQLGLGFSDGLSSAGLFPADVVGWKVVQVHSTRVRSADHLIALLRQEGASPRKHSLLITIEPPRPVLDSDSQQTNVCADKDEHEERREREITRRRVVGEHHRLRASDH